MSTLLPPEVLENCLAQAEGALSIARGSSKVREHIAAQEEAIKALADALEAQKDTAPGQEWHSPHCMAAGRASCVRWCTEARTALRMAGRLP